MIFRGIDSENDWMFGKGKSDYFKDEKALEANVKTRIMSWLGNCFFSPDEGVDWKNLLDADQQESLNDAVKTEILQSYGVIGVTDVSAEFVSSTRNFQVTYIMDTIYGTGFQNLISQAAGVSNA